MSALVIDVTGVFDSVLMLLIRLPVISMRSSFCGSACCAKAATPLNAPIMASAAALRGLRLNITIPS